VDGSALSPLQSDLITIPADPSSSTPLDCDNDLAPSWRMLPVDDQVCR